MPLEIAITRMAATSEAEKKQQASAGEHVTQGNNSDHVDIFFGVRGSRVSVDHGYALYGAIARVLETPDAIANGLTNDDALTNGAGWLHHSDEVSLHLLRGVHDLRGWLLLGSRARFGLRLPAALIPKVLPLAGKRLVLPSHNAGPGDSLRVGVPHVQALRPAPTLAARLVTTKNGQDEQRFDREIIRQLSELGITTAPPIRGRRRVLRIKDRAIVGYSVRIEGLSAAESLRLQEHGLGGRRKMGCGMFLPIRGGDTRGSETRE
jgi:CRISPR-associated protein Cas6